MRTSGRAVAASGSHPRVDHTHAPILMERQSFLREVHKVGDPGAFGPRMLGTHIVYNSWRNRHCPILTGSLTTTSSRESSWVGDFILCDVSGMALLSRIPYPYSLGMNGDKLPRWRPKAAGSTCKSWCAYSLDARPIRARQR
jgi:hypothetical protein